MPDKYFDELPGKIMAKIDALPDFDKASSINPFVTPEGYFEKLPVTIAEKISAGKSERISWSEIFTRPRFVIPLACVILVAGLYIFSKSDISNYYDQELTIDEVQNSTFFQSIDEDIFVDILNGQTTIETNDSLSQYLIDNNIELSEIENAL